MMQRLNNIANEVRRSNDIAAMAAADARAAHAEAMSAIDEVNKNIQKGNQIARESAEANKKTAYYAEKAHDQLKYGTTSVRIND